MRTNRNNSIPLAGTAAGRRVPVRTDAGEPPLAADAVPAASSRPVASRGRPLASGAVRARAGAGRRSYAGEQVAQPTRGAAAAKRVDRARGEQNFMKYAQDNRFIRWFYALTTGPARLGFYLVVAALIGAGVYFPARDLYVAHRTEDILAQQVAIRERYNERLDEEVDGYLSQEGIEDAARKDLGMVMPGEQTITVEGLDEDGNPIVQEPETGGEADAGGATADGSSGASDGDSDGDGDAATAAGVDGADADKASEDEGGKLKGADATDKTKTGGDTKAAASGKEPTTSAEVEAAERAVYENSEWYWKVLDALFLFDGAGGMAVVSTGDAS